MSKKAKSKKASGKSKYRIKNWAEYNDALRDRGSLTILLSPEALAQWNDQRPRHRGAPFQYSDLAIQTMLTLMAVYDLQLRQVEGLMRSLVKLMHLSLAVPDYSTLCRRRKTVSITLPVRRYDEPLHLVVDSTGLKVYGEGEWKVRQHGYSRRRTWLKLHLAVDESTGQVQAVALTTNDVDDAAEVAPLLKQIQTPLMAFSADGSYDKHKVYNVLTEKARQQESPIRVNIPPRRDAKITQHGNSSLPPLVRDENLRAIRTLGRKAWKEQSGYHRRSLAENTIFRYKTIIGPRLNARLFASQAVEATIGCTILNRMLTLGMPNAYKVS